MAGESDDLDKLFESVADGESVDWDALEREAPDEETRALIRQLRLIADVAEVHRSQVDEVTPPDVALTAPATGGVLPIQPAVGRRVLPGPHTTPAGAVPPGNVPPGRVPPSGVPPGGSAPDPNFVTWGHLLLVRKIGEGSYGEVYHAHDTWLDHPVALKLLKLKSERRVEPSDLLHEARKLARVRHHNVVTVHGADRHNGRVGFWMDFVDGETLAVRVLKGRLSAGEAASVGQEVCQALAAVHRANIIHRDVKAQNVMRAHDGGRIILMDFGAGEFVGDETRNPQGTPLYMAPELFDGEGAGIKTDIYAAGVLLFHLVTNAFPVTGGSMRELREAHARGLRRRLRDERPDLPVSFITTVERAIDPDPTRRYATAGDMEAKLNGEKTTPITVPVPLPAPVPTGPSLLDYAKRAAGMVAPLVLLTMVVGFIAARVFDVTLRVDRDFSLGAVDIFAVGTSVVLPFLVMWLVGAAVLAAATGILALFPGESLAGSLRRLVLVFGAWDPSVTAAVIVLTSVGWWAILNFVLFDFYSTLLALWSDPATTADLTSLANRSVFTRHYLASAYSSMAVGLAVWRWFPSLERGAVNPSTIRFWKWGAVVVAISFVAWTGAPRRLVLERFPVVEFDKQSGLVIGSAGNELLVYAPDESGRPRRRMKADAPGLRRTGETRFLFDPGPTK